MNYKKINGKYKYYLCDRYLYFFSNKPFTEKVIAPYINLLKDRIVILDGYCWDGASYSFFIKDKYILRASLIHDALYQLIRNDYLSIKYKDFADKLFYKICIEDGMNKILALSCYYAVKLFGGVFI